MPYPRAGVRPSIVKQFGRASLPRRRATSFLLTGTRRRRGGPERMSPKYAHPPTFKAMTAPENLRTGKGRRRGGPELGPSA